MTVRALRPLLAALLLANCLCAAHAAPASPQGIASASSSASTYDASAGIAALASAPTPAPVMASAPGVAMPIVAAPMVATPGSAAPAGQLAGPAANLLQTIAALCLVLGLLAGCAWLMKRYGAKASGASAHLRTVGALSLGGRERIIVVEIGDQWIVVGASPGRVNALATMPRQDLTAGPASLAAHGSGATSFAAWLKQTMAQRNAH